MDRVKSVVPTVSLPPRARPHPTRGHRHGLLKKHVATWTFDFGGAPWMCVLGYALHVKSMLLINERDHARRMHEAADFNPPCAWLPRVSEMLIREEPLNRVTQESKILSSLAWLERKPCAPWARVSLGCPWAGGSCDADRRHARACVPACACACAHIQDCASHAC